MTTKTVKIDKNIPIPPRPQDSKWPWKKLQVGDSFHMDNTRTATSAMCLQAGKKYNIKLATRREGEGYRVWRIA